MTTRNVQWKTKELPPSENLDIELPRIAAILLAQRGFTEQDAVRGFLDPEYYPPAPPGELPDIPLAVQELAQAIRHQKRILIWGDFDVDGQTATALLLDGLGMLGADTAFYIPDRLTESHGIHIPTLSEQIALLAPEILLTCDTGITAHEAIEYAIQQGVSVIVTDHHDLPADGILPAASANINPKRLPVDHPLRTLPGVGVAYKLVEALFAHFQHDSASLNSLLDLVALGIVADVAEQTGDTRYLLQQGLQQLRNTARPGLQALYKVARIQPDALNSESIGFQLAPRLNAVGRLDNASHAVKLLTTHNTGEATLIAAQLEGLNQKRRIMQRDILSAARSILDNQPALLQFNAIVIHQPGWHTGLLGIVAGQLAEQHQRPCILLTSAVEDSEARGSARSAPGYDIGAAIAAQAELLTTFGGHAGAAGMALPIENIDRFRRRLSTTLSKQRSGTQPPALTIDLEVALKEITPELVEQIHLLAPFGEGNPPVVLMSQDLRLEHSAVLGRDQLHRRLTVASTDGETRQVLWWNGMDYRLPGGAFDLAFTAGWNIYQGRREMALTLVAYRENESTAPALAPPTRQLVDWRDKQEQLAVSLFKKEEPEGIIWAEGYNCDKQLYATRPGMRRHELAPAPALLIYTTPPSRAVLNWALEATGAERIYLFGAPPPYRQHNTAFLQCLARLCNFTLNHDPTGLVDITRMAGALASTNHCVIQGLRFLAAKGEIDLDERDEEIRITRLGRLSQASNPDDIRIAFAGELQEIESYRRAFRRMKPEALVDGA